MRIKLHFTSFRSCIIYALMMLKQVVSTTSYHRSVFYARFRYVTVLHALYRLCICVAMYSKQMIMLCD
jgi:hypothetical protein